MHQSSDEEVNYVLTDLRVEDQKTRLGCVIGKRLKFLVKKGKLVEETMKKTIQSLKPSKSETGSRIRLDGSKRSKRAKM